MKLTLLLILLFISTLAIFATAKENVTKPARKTLRTVKSLKKSSKSKKASKSNEELKSESYHVPIIVSPLDNIPHEKIPVNLELHDDDRFLHSSPDMHPIEPIHLALPLEGHVHDHRSVLAGKDDPFFHREPIHHDDIDSNLHGPVAIPQDYPYGEDYQGLGNNEAFHGGPPEKFYPEDYSGDLSAIPGIPGVDYPIYARLPETRFKCLDHTATPGFYADVDTKCQVWHYCQPDGRHDRFLCPNGTVFDQLTRVCNWWFNVHCEASLSHYDVNFDLYREPKKTPPPQSLDLIHHQEDLRNDDRSNPNSFLEHVRSFESGLDKPQPFEYPNPIQAAASPHLHTYHHQSDDFDHSVPIYYDASNSHAFSAPRTAVYAPEKEGTVPPVRKHKQKKKKRDGRRKRRRHPKIRKDHHEEIPVYREAKASPTRKYRIVRRRKIPKT